jgi:gluconate kinase
MSLVILFGLPGTGKTYVGKIFEKYFDYYFYEGDNDLSQEMKQAIKEKKVFTDQMRDVFFKKLIDKIQNLLALSEVEGKTKHKNLVVAQTFIREKYRINLINKIPETEFILVKTKKSIREKRLNLRKDYPIEMEYARKMCLNFDKPLIDHLIIINNDDGDKNIKEQIRLFNI